MLLELQRRSQRVLGAVESELGNPSERAAWGSRSEVQDALTRATTASQRARSAGRRAPVTRSNARNWRRRTSPILHLPPLARADVLRANPASDMTPLAHSMTEPPCLLFSVAGAHHADHCGAAAVEPVGYYCGSCNVAARRSRLSRCRFACGREFYAPMAVDEDKRRCGYH